MKAPEVQSLSYDALRKLMAERDERHYLLIDVRQPAEYFAGHIPGALFIPLLEFEARLFELPLDRELVFYCSSGGRSLAAATLAVDAEITGKGIYNLEGGIFAWKGKKLGDFPRVQVFEKNAGFEQLLYTAMDLEKGAWRFYRRTLEMTEGSGIAPTLSRLSEAETAHARAVYRYWAPTQKDPRGFEALFEALPGEILEGGEPFDEVVARLEDADGPVCLRILELALHVEYSAYDLYRNMAEKSDDEREKSAFLSIAQAEKGHMRMLTRALAQCEAPED